MACTNDTETHRTSTALVTVRVPDGTDRDLTSEAARRLTRTPGVRTATVDSVTELSPGLSATAITVRATLELTGGTVSETLADASFVTVEARR